MRQKNRYIGVGRTAFGCQCGSQRQVARQAHDAGQPLRETQAGHQGHGTALRETGNHDASGRYAALDLALDQLVHAVLGLAHSLFVLARCDIGAQNVVPGRHLVAAVDADGNHRRIREQKADRTNAGQIQLLCDRYKVTAVRAQAVQNKNRGDWLLAGLGFDNFKRHGVPGRDCIDSSKRVL